MTFTDVEEFKKIGFTGFKSINELFFNSSLIPDIKGVYCIFHLNDKGCDFLLEGCGGHFKKKNPNVALLELQNNWVKNTNVIYIGKAGGEGKKATLRSRLKQYLQFGQGKPVGHWGGRYIWQLKDSQDLIICWKPLGKQEPRAYEAELISEFVSKFGKRPFANLVD
jgi:hypothetical protein